MKYRVPLYTISNKQEKLLASIIVENTSLGAFEANTGAKIHISSGYVNYRENSFDQSLLCPYVKKIDFNGSNMVKPSNMENTVEIQKVIKR